jgi:drug/metabolite transporter (DMT)-like permease
VVQPTHRNTGLGIAMVLSGAVFFAVNGTASKLVLQAGVDPLRLTALRAGGAAVGLVLLALLTNARGLAVTRAQLPLLVVYGLAGFFFVPLLYFVAIKYLPVGIALLFEYTAPVLVALWMRFVQGHVVRFRLWVGLVASLAGLACVAEVWGDLRLDPRGIAAALAAAVLLAAYFLLGARGVARRDPLSLTAWAFGVAAVAGAAVRPWWSFDATPLGHRSHGLPVWLLCGYVVVFGSIVPYLLLAGALRHLPATSVSIVGMVEPVIAATVAWLALAEHLNVAQLAGGALILAGVTLAETARVATPAETAPPRVPYEVPPA